MLNNKKASLTGQGVVYNFIWCLVWKDKEESVRSVPSTLSFRVCVSRTGAVFCVAACYDPSYPFFTLCSPSLCVQIEMVDKISCSLSLMRRLPPNKIEQNLSGLLNLVPEETDELLQRVDQPLTEATDADVV